ncbi:hypothetical protein TrLO_g9489 [Triparma laevis f. longispina]|uniref:Uncharacterized protein n=1 Tax=Triparma laevis f. longispina TaxID=1714387 RepID=A0A9W7DNX8_9STRA|nr:hypothetical protein TrLO_g9489 [Triparma laevis f. longispina]
MADRQKDGKRRKSRPPRHKRKKNRVEKTEDDDDCDDDVLAQLRRQRLEDAAEVASSAPQPLPPPPLPTAPLTPPPPPKPPTNPLCLLPYLHSRTLSPSSLPSNIRLHYTLQTRFSFNPPPLLPLPPTISRSHRLSSLTLYSPEKVISTYFSHTDVYLSSPSNPFSPFCVGLETPLNFSPTSLHINKTFLTLASTSTLSTASPKSTLQIYSEIDSQQSKPKYKVSKSFNINTHHLGSIIDTTHLKNSSNIITLNSHSINSVNPHHVITYTNLIPKATFQNSGIRKFDEPTKIISNDDSVIFGFRSGKLYDVDFRSNTFKKYECGSNSITGIYRSNFKIYTIDGLGDVRIYDTRFTILNKFETQEGSENSKFSNNKHLSGITFKNNGIYVPSRNSNRVFLKVFNEKGDSFKNVLELGEGESGVLSGEGERCVWGGCGNYYVF